MTRHTRAWSDERGVALIVSLMATLMLSALGAALILNTTTETMLTHNFHNGQQALYAADAGVERGIQDLIREPSWNAVLAGGRLSGFLDTPPYVLPDGTSADFVELTAALQADTDADYGVANPNRPVWRLYAHGPLESLLPTQSVVGGGYVVVWVADDPGETDGDPTADGNGVVLVHAEGFGERGSNRSLEASAVRAASTAAESGYVAQRGQDEQNRRARKEAVQTPGAELTEMHMAVSGGYIEYY
jgi:hypothetical protein